MKKQKLKLLNTAQPIAIETAQLKQISDRILKQYPLEKIICFGSKVNSVQNKSCFAPEEDTTIRSAELNSYSLLLVPAADEVVPDIKIQQRIEEDCKTIANVAVIVDRVDKINQALLNGSSFYTTIYHSGNVIYDNQKEMFVAPGAGESIGKRIVKREQFWEHWNNLSLGFLKGAEYFAQEKINELSVFMLHQSLQHCYSGMLRVLMGYRTNSNSLRRLLQLIENALPESSLAPFNRTTPEYARLTALLLKGFSDARYNDKFEITDEEVSKLIDRIRHILMAADTTCQERLANLKAGKMKYIT